jgi:DNA-directed RNA polymerase specialized sigma24 family protein
MPEFSAVLTSACAPVTLQSHMTFDCPQGAEEYFHLRARLVGHFRSRGCRDPEDLADEVFLRALCRAGDGALAENGLAAYCYGIAANVLKESRRTVVHVDLICASRLASVGENRDAPILLEQCLRRLRPSERRLLTDYELGDKEDRAKLAVQLGTSPNGLRIRACRLREHIQAEFH